MDFTALHDCFTHSLHRLKWEIPNKKNPGHFALIHVTRKRLIHSGERSTDVETVLLTAGPRGRPVKIMNR